MEFGAKFMNQVKAVSINELANNLSLRNSFVPASAHWPVNFAICLTVDSLPSPANRVKVGNLNPLGNSILSIQSGKSLLYTGVCTSRARGPQTS